MQTSIGLYYFDNKCNCCPIDQSKLHLKQFYRDNLHRLSTKYSKKGIFI